ncbi:MAG: alpha/beta fold hydrolase [Bdellovibrionales bacterium]|nr:alpha/beta fold hydrolase [Bdellovibrionales bacterium]
MTIKADILGNPQLPPLVCLHGMLGGPENFKNMMGAWDKEFCTVLIDLHPQNRESGLADSDKSLSRVHYDDSARELHECLTQLFPARPFYFLGVSLGGKVVLDFAMKYPELYAGGVVTDVGPGSLQGSGLYQFVAEVVPSLNLNQDWNKIKQEFRSKISENAIRVFIQTQVMYSHETQSGVWKPAVRGLNRLLTSQNIDKQWDQAHRLRALTIVLKATQFSGIEDNDYARMLTMPVFKLEEVTGASHFIPVTHPQEIQRAVLELKSLTKYPAVG